MNSRNPSGLAMRLFSSSLYLSGGSITPEKMAKHLGCSRSLAAKTLANLAADTGDLEKVAAGVYSKPREQHLLKRIRFANPVPHGG